MKKLVLAAVALAAMGGSALAADLTPVVPIIPPPPAPAPKFDWSGPYAGIYGGIYLGVAFDVGVDVGTNFTSGGPLVFGLDLQLGALFAGGVGFETALDGRIGVALGAEDRALLFAEAGVGFITAGPGGTWNAGGGLEFALGDSASLFTQARVIGAFGGGPLNIQVQWGVNWHFGGM